MSWGTITVGSLTLSETDSIDDKVNANTGGRSVVLTGQEMTFGKMTLDELRAKAEDLVLLMDRVLPVQFSRKTDRNGYYRVVDAGTVTTHWQDEGSWFTWNLSLELVGPDNAVDVESRMTHIVRSNAHGLSGTRWHAPAIGHYAYFLGAATPSSIVRTTEAGPMTVYQSIPAVNPRWGSPVGSFMAGRARFLSGGIVRSGAGIGIPVTGWELNNGLVRVRPATYTGTTLFIAVYDGTTWREIPWDVRVAGASVFATRDLLTAHVLRNEPEQVALRLIAYQPSTSLRVTIDLILRRGSRFLEGYIQRTSAGTISVTPDIAEATTLGTGYFRSSGTDATGLYWVGGSSKSFVLANTGGVEVSSSTSMDFWVGAEVPGVSIGGTNNGFELGNTSGWSGLAGTTIAVDSVNVKYGTFSGKITAPGGTSQARVESNTRPGTAGKQYTITGWVMSPVALPSSGGEIAMHWYNGTTYMSTNSVQFPALSAGVWTPLEGTFTAPANTSYISRQFALNGTPAAGAVLYGDSIEIREATPSGDQAYSLRDQYLAVPNEQTGVIVR